MRFGDGSLPVDFRGKALVGGLGGQSPPEAEACCSFAHNILKNGHRKCMYRYIDFAHNLIKKALREMQTLCTGCSKAEAKILALPQTLFQGAQDSQNLISWRWSLPSPRDPVW